MGWTGYYITGKINRKVECDKILNCEHLKVEKSRMEGSTYYAAVRVVKKEVKQENNKYVFEEIAQEEQKVFGVVILTATKKDRWDTEFCYKEMRECVGPYPRRCPDSILNLLTGTMIVCPGVEKGLPGVQSKEKASEKCRLGSQD